MTYFSVKNWAEFQHYKKRHPPWIKLHMTLLTDYHFSALPDTAKAHLMSIWLLAASMDNKIPADAGWLRNRINADSPIDLEALASAGFIIMEQHASNMLADCKHDASNLSLSDRGETEAETEAEAETEKRREDKDPSQSPDATHPSPGCSQPVDEPDDEPSPDDEKPDPLLNYPFIAKHYNNICGWIETDHEHAKIPPRGSTKDRQWRDELSKLVRIDGFDERTVVDVLAWLFVDDTAARQKHWPNDTQQGRDFWREQIRSVMPLRKDRNGVGMTKFAQVHEKWQKATGGLRKEQKPKPIPHSFSGPSFHPMTEYAAYDKEGVGWTYLFLEDFDRPEAREELRRRGLWDDPEKYTHWALLAACERFGVKWTEDGPVGDMPAGAQYWHKESVSQYHEAHGDVVDAGDNANAEEVA